MRLLKIQKAEPSDLVGGLNAPEPQLLISLEEHFSDIPRYAILSHRWGNPAEELKFTDVKDGITLSKGQGHEKVVGCCLQALAEGLEYVWIDTCCIDKSSSAELSEAINSMYIWYQQAVVCYAYLEDVSFADLNLWDPKISCVEGSVWFKRAWTLQELVAPVALSFFAKNWEYIASKSEMAERVPKVTNIAISVLQDGLSSDINVAQIMS
ncbi:hypothetical protein GLAREA_01091 [Glarea lozoyensis ATCC 20868]|uniref:Heterokaryon incompatibility domain-containing protein n=1 Tax=Glarea lozoyensis (strain ATCC 20868 / MF5171) TaxID=1116229 RepID=S3DD60_GLAL2|nr:uncharacterized protein GLAREA_01091 [Glarea lozoyensis ATCC 20868]EPE29931.1 hypothetical protein GLAREA_01091 [Glarea lozoyensis ATCC 20868]